MHWTLQKPKTRFDSVAQLKVTMLAWQNGMLLFRNEVHAGSNPVASSRSVTIELWRKIGIRVRTKTECYFDVACGFESR